MHSKKIHFCNTYKVIYQKSITAFEYDFPIYCWAINYTDPSKILIDRVESIEYCIYLGGRHLRPMVPKLSNSKDMEAQTVSWNKIKALLEDKDLINKSKLYAFSIIYWNLRWLIHACTYMHSNIISIDFFDFLSDLFFSFF